jgi:hypothetical protein
MPSFIDRLERNGFLRGYYNQLQYEAEMKDLPTKTKKAIEKVPLIDKDGWTLVVKKRRR